MTKENIASKAKNGFSLVEILIVMAMISIISAAVLVSVSGQKKRAQETRALAELSGIMQYIVMCQSDGGNVNSPNGGSGGGNICSLGSNYGKWPKVGASSALSYFGNYSANFSVNSWYFYITNGTRKVCCNNTSSRCALINNSASCTGSTVLE